MQMSNLDTFRPFDDDLKDENNLNLGTDLDLDTFRPFDNDLEDKKDSQIDASLSVDLDTFRPFDDETIDVDTELVPERGLTGGQQAASLGIDIGGSIGSQVLGAATGVGYIPIAFTGGLASNILAQMTAEGRDFFDISWGRALSAGFINLIPGAAATKLARPIATELGRGALIGAADVTFQKAIDERRMPTVDEYLLASSLGGVFGTVGGAITKKANEAKGLVYGMNYSDIDTLLLTKKGEPLRKALDEQGVTWDDKTLQEQTQRLFERISVQKTKNADMKITHGWTGTGGVFDSLNPFLVTNRADKTLRTKAFQFDQRVKTLQNFQQRLPKDVSDALDGIKSKQGGKVMKEFGADIDSFLTGNEMSEKLSEQTWSTSLTKFRNMEDEFYEDLITILGSEDRYDLMYGNLSTNERAFFKNKIERALNNKGYRARQYKALIPGSKEQTTGEKFVIKNIDDLNRDKTDTGEIYYKAMYREIEEFQRKKNPLVISKEEKAAKKASGENVDQYITTEQLVGKDGESGLIATHIDSLIKRSKGVGSTAILKNTLPGNVELTLKNHIPGKLESKWLGEVTDVAFRMKQGNLQLGQQLAKFNANKQVAQSLVNANLISTRPQGELQEKIGTFGEFYKQDFYTTPEMSDALEQIFSNKNLFEFNQKQLDLVLNVWRRGESLSKAVKVLANTPSYAVNFLGANMSMLGMGMIPSVNSIASFKKGLGKGLRQSRFLEKTLNHIKKPNAKERLAILNELEELQSLGVLDADTASLFADDIAAGLKVGSGQIDKVLQKVTGSIGKIYSLSDVAARIAVYEHNVRHLGKIFPEFSVSNSMAFKRMAAEVTNDTYQNYARVSRIIRELSKLGFMPQFVTFTAELTRNVFHQYKIAAQMLKGTFGKTYGLTDAQMSSANLSEMRKEGAKRMGALSSLIVGSSFGISAINKGQGIDEEKDNYYRSIFPQYLRNKSLLYKVDPENPNNVAVANMSYIAPQAVIGSLVQGLFSGKVTERNAVEMLMEEFMGEGTFFTKEVLRAVDNRDKYGEKITRATEFNQQMYDILNYVISESFETGTQRELQKFKEAYSGKGLFTKGEVWARQFGFRFQKLEVDRYVSFKLQDLSDAQSEYKGDYTKAKKYEFTEGKINEQELEERYQLNNERSRDIYNELSKTYRETVSQSGLSKDQVDEIFTGSRSNLSSKNKIAILSGLDYTNMPRELVVTQQEQYDTMFGLDTDINNYNDFQIQKQIKSFQRTDPNKHRAFQRIYKNAKKVDGQRNLTTVQKLLKKLSVYDRAIMIKDLGLDNRQELDKLRRLGIYTDQVKQTMRALGQ